MSANHPAMAARVRDRRGPRKGSALAASDRTTPAVYVEHYAPAYGDTRAPRDGGRQSWHRKTDARPFSTTTGFNSRL